MRSLPLTTSTLIAAYQQGIFPMDVDGELHWFSPDPRAILPVDGFRVSRTLRQRCRQGTYKIRIDERFTEVMRACADRSEGTWISDAIVDAYTKLHTLGLAHSVEAYDADGLAGGLYGVTLGGAFFGESMFHRRRDASKVALVALVERMRERGYRLLDVQFTTPHLEQFGVIEIPRAEYLDRLAKATGTRCRFAD
ncbi:MAG: leucyl/phenylalanyl-tRNA--protein transferase [Phycisphaerae bacterium]|nr:leucyl/phenylalanyl-tRNA--protein transferase [Phycisphaerae bacterium]